MRLIWSHSRSQRYSRCPRQLFHEKQVKSQNNESYKDTIPPWKVVGDTVHETIQGILEKSQEEYGDDIDKMRISPNQTIDMSREIFNSKISGKELIIGPDNDREEVEDRLRKTTKKHLHNWVKRFKSFYKGHTVIGIELDETWDYQGAKIRTIVDFLSSKNNTLYITDWKSNKDRLLSFNDSQMAAYQIWAKEKFPDFSKVESFHFYTKDGRLKKNKISSSFTDNLRDRMIFETSQWESDDLEQFPTRPGGKSCSYCRWTGHCEDVIFSNEF